MDIVEELLANTAAKPHTWGEDIGESVTGEIENLRTTPAINYQTKLPETWADGTPKMVYVLTLAAEDVELESEEDDGRRDVYMRGHLHVSMVRALKRARVSRLDELLGMRASITLTGRGEKRKGQTPAKLFSVELEPAGV